MRPIIHNAVEYRKAKNITGNEAILGKSKGAEASILARKVLRDADSEKTALLKAGDAEEETTENDQDERYVFLYELAKHSGNETELRDQVINTLIAGRDTTASLMSSTMFVLSRRPDIWSKLQAEVATLNGKPPTFDQIKDLKYLRNILHEALRLYPVVPINAKFANKDTWLPRGGGADGQSPIFVQKGQMVIWVLYSMHRRKDFWGQDAEEFRPERWEGLLPGFHFLPFNGGPRICPGKSIHSFFFIFFFLNPQDIIARLLNHFFLSFLLSLLLHPPLHTSPSSRLNLQTSPTNPHHPGQQFALTEASYTIIRLCQQFSRIEVVPGQESRPWTESLNLTCAVTGGVNVRCWK